MRTINNYSTIFLAGGLIILLSRWVENLEIPFFLIGGIFWAFSFIGALLEENK